MRSPTVRRTVPVQVTTVSPFSARRSRAPDLGSEDHEQEEGPMGADDKADNMADEWKGKVKEAAGDITGDRRLEAEGEADQAEANLKQAGEKVKDAFRD
jgi:uncharacterized protein YjbJ (UPF0337 family)